MLNLRFQTPENQQPSLAPRIMVVGVGGAGTNAVNNMINAGLEGVDFLVCNTDAQALDHSRAPHKIQLGKTVTGGLGAGTKPEVGRAAAEESINDVMQYLAGAHMVFITSGLGGGTGTGVSPVIARACKEAGILTVGVVTKPFHFEGPSVMRVAEEGLREMQSYVDTLIVIPNQNLFRIANERTTIVDSFKLADNVLQSAVRGITDLMVMPGLVNLDFNDIKTTMTEMGKAMMGTGEATGERRAIMAAEAAINNPLLDDVTMKGAKGVIINIAGGNDMTLFEIDEACNRIREEVDVDANIIFGTSVDDALQGSVRVTVVATGIDPLYMAGSKDTSGAVQTNAVSKQPAKPFSYGQGRANTNPAPATPKTTPHRFSDAVPTAIPTAHIQGNAFIPPAPAQYDQLAAFDRTVPYDHIMGGIQAGPEWADTQDSEYNTDLTPNDQTEQTPATVTGPMASFAQSAHPQSNAFAGFVTPSYPNHGTDIPASLTQQTTPTHRRAPAPTSAEPALSLFQRITQRVRRTMEQAFDGADDDFAVTQQRYAARIQPSVTSHEGPSPQQTRSAQPNHATTSRGGGQHAAARESVAIAQPAKPATGPQQELDLEIPAFLRRQAS